jgi:hypothetical protein
MKLLISVLICVSTAKAFALEGSFQMTGWSCASGAAPKFEFDSAQDKALFNFRSQGSYDQVFIAGGYWGMERGYFVTRANQLCLEVRESVIRERPFWMGRAFKACTHFETASEEDLSFRQSGNEQVCDRGDITIINYRRLEAEAKSLLF